MAERPRPLLPLRRSPALRRTRTRKSPHGTWRPALAWVCVLSVFSQAGTPARAADSPPNFLVVVADDVGIDKIGAYRELACIGDVCPAPPPTPHIDALAARGVRFDEVWATPLCSSTRATLLTGDYGFRTGIGGLAPTAESGAAAKLGLDPHAPTLAHRLQARGYATAAVGKWHLAGCPERDPKSGECAPNSPPLDPRHPVRSGFDSFTGSLANLTDDGGDYCQWRKTTVRRSVDDPNDIQVESQDIRRYATRVTADDAIAQLSELSEPWLLWVAFNAAHQPLHEVPERDDDCRHRDTGDPVGMYDAMLTRMDGELGRLLAALQERGSVAERTTVIFVGDNGTVPTAVRPPHSTKRAKGTLFEGGIRVPAVIAGAGVSQSAAGRHSRALVNTTDVFATVMALAGAEPCSEARPCGRDAVSLVPQLRDPSAAGARRHAYSELFPSSAGPLQRARQVIRDERFKLHRRYGNPGRSLRLFDLSADPLERDDLLQRPLSSEAAAAFGSLSRALGALVGACIALDDRDGDCVPDARDNCFTIPNGPRQAEVPGVGDQRDGDGDGVGDACEGRSRRAHGPDADAS